MKVEALNCPNCGAGVESDRTLCQFCKTRLKTVACPTCFGLMFIGAKFCGHCGAIAAPVEVSLDSGVGDCPRCRKPLNMLGIGDAKVRGCSKCDGIWMDVLTFENTCADREKQSAVFVYFENRSIRPQLVTKIAYVPCPDCGQLMNRNNFARASGVIVDICKQHGIWFDADELPAIIEFIRKGGMQIAREREKLQIREERDRLRDDLRKQEITERKFGQGKFWQKEESSAVRSFISKLFD